MIDWFTDQTPAVPGLIHSSPYMLAEGTLSLVGCCSSLYLFWQTCTCSLASKIFAVGLDLSYIRKKNPSNFASASAFCISISLSTGPWNKARNNLVIIALRLFLYVSHACLSLFLFFRRKTKKQKSYQKMHKILGAHIGMNQDFFLVLKATHSEGGHR